MQRVAQQLISSGKVAHAYLGVQLSDGNGGAQVGQVVSGAPAADAGVRNRRRRHRDRRQDDHRGRRPRHRRRRQKPGDTVTLKVRRGGSTSEIKVKLGTRPN